MKRIQLLCTLFLSLALAAPAVAATSNIYCSPSGSDTLPSGQSNFCQQATSPCKTPSQCLAQVSPSLNGDVVVNFDVGNYYSPPFAPDGGSPTAGDVRGLVDISGFDITPRGSLRVLCSTQKINPANLVVGAIDGGNLGGSNPYEGWVQLAIDGGFGNYAVDAGYAYLDGGAATLITNSLVGTYIQFTAGASLIVAPIVSNDSRTINFVTHANVFGTQAVAPTAASTYNIVAPASHFFPWPQDAGAATAYSLANLYIGGSNANAAPQLFTPNTNGQIPPDPAISVFYCDFTDSPQGTHSNFETVDNFSTAPVDLRHVNLKNTGNAAVVNNYGGELALTASYTKPSSTNPSYTAQSGTGWLTGDYLQSGGGSSDVIFAQFGDLFLSDSVISPNDSNAATISGLYNENLVINNVLINQGNNTAAAIQTRYRSNAYLNGVVLVTDGGAGLVSCGASGSTSLLAVTTPDAGFKLISTDNGATYITGTTESVQDGGTAGVHADCNAGTSCCYTSY